MENLIINPQIRTLKSLMDEIRFGKVCVPPFQRDFVWGRDQIKDLFQSIQRNYPIGSILLWKPNQKYDWRPNYNIGRYRLDNEEDGNTYILDGYQRLSTIFSCLTNPETTSLNNSDNNVDKTLFDLYYDLSDETFLYLRSKSSRQPYQVPLYVFMSTSEFRKYSRMYIEPNANPEMLDTYLDKADNLSRTLVDYQLACVDIKGADIEEAVDIFSRLNSKGVEISIDWMVNALSYNTGFRFADLMDELVGDIEAMGFGTLKRNALFRCFQSSFGKLYFDQNEIDKLAKRSDFSIIIKKSAKNIKKAVSFLMDRVKMPSNKFLPYVSQLIFIMVFFEKIDTPTDEQKEALEKWFWLTTYSNYFTMSSLSEQRKAYVQFVDSLTANKMDSLFYISDKVEQYETLPFPEKIQLGSVRCSAVCIFVEAHMHQLITNESSVRSSFFYGRLLMENKDSIQNAEEEFVKSLGILYKR